MDASLEARLLLRLPAELRDRVAQVAESNRRSMTKEIQVAIERHVKSEESR